MTELGFWAATAALLYTYIGYPILLAVWAAARGHRSGLRHGSSRLPSVSVILAVRDEAANIARRVANLLAQRYPPELLEICIASDGSTDGTYEIGAALARRHVQIRLTRCPDGGKAAAINAAVRLARGEVLVFADARQEFELDAVQRLAAAFAEPRLGAVSGALRFLPSPARIDLGLAAYWRLESWIRRQEGRVGAAVGVTGSVYAARRSLFPQLPPGLLLDDVYAPLHIALRGWRIGYEPNAVAYDREPAGFDHEFRRKVRTLTGNYQLLRLLPGLFNPLRNRLFVPFLSHKLLRLLSPFLLAAIFASSLALSARGYGVMVGAQLLVYAVGLLGIAVDRARRWGPVRVAAAFLVLNAAAATAFWNWIGGRELRVWLPAGYKTRLTR